MRRLQRVTDLSEPPKLGRRYLVPCVYYTWNWREQWWPVFRPRHDDLEFFKFEPQHYHIDPRFVSNAIYRSANAIGTSYMCEAAELFGRPLSEVHTLPLGEPELRPRICLREMPRYLPLPKMPEPVIALRKHYAGAPCARAKSGWICPHRKTPLGSFPVREDGKIECPLHGLRIDAATGKVAEC